MGYLINMRVTGIYDENFGIDTKPFFYLPKKYSPSDSSNYRYVIPVKSNNINQLGILEISHSTVTFYSNESFSKFIGISCIQDIDVTYSIVS
jgi:hypothetical protein